jgi:drug/metabolite transporter (DMT)-like permease
MVLGEVVTPQAMAGIGFVVLGIFIVYWWGRLPQLIRDPFRLIREPGTRYAILTGLVIALYSVWDKEGVRYVNPFLYMYLMTLGTVLLLAPYLLKALTVDTAWAAFRANSPTIVASGLLTFLAYGLVLTALRFSRVSYIAPAREVGIVVSVLLGALVLKEPFGRGRAVGSGLIVTGLGLIATAP